MEPIIPSRALPIPTPLELSPTNTIVDSDVTRTKSISAGPTKSTVPDKKDSDTDTNGDVIVISQKKKWSLLMVFCLGFFIDIWMYSGMSLLPPPHIEDLTLTPSLLRLHWPYLYRPERTVRTADLGDYKLCSHLRCLPIILGSSIRLIFRQTSIRLRFPHPRYLVAHHFIPTGPILVLCHSSHLGYCRRYLDPC
jgi:hypothetical protein